MLSFLAMGIQDCDTNIIQPVDEDNLFFVTAVNFRCTQHSLQLHARLL